MKKICAILLLTLTSCSFKGSDQDYNDFEDDEREYWRRVEECGFKFPNSDLDKGKS